MVTFGRQLLNAYFQCRGLRALRPRSFHEKISYLQQKLSTAGGINAEETKGDFCYYAPWGNLAVFYQGIGYSESLYILGTIRSGKELLARQKGDFRAMIDRVKTAR